MNSRERVLLALAHKEPDRVPFDLGGTVVTGISATAYRALRQYLGLPEVPVTLADTIQQIAKVDDDVKEKLGVDVESLAPRSSATHQLAIKDAGDYTYFHDEFRIGWRMPKAGGLYYDLYEFPLAGAQVTPGDIDRFPWPDPLDPARFAGLKETAAKLIHERQRAVVVGSMSAGVMEIYSWMRGFEDFFADFAANTKLAERFMDRVLELHLAYWDKMCDTLGDAIDVAGTADDFAGQCGLLIAPESYRKLCKPRHKALFDFIHKRSKAKIFFHSCGAVRAIIPDLIEIGCDILNPVQVSATGMAPAELKREYGKDLVFWGGGVDTQGVLGTGTPAQVREDTRRCVQAFMPGGGFIFNTVHNIQGNVPPENIVAMWEALREFGVYGR